MSSPHVIIIAGPNGSGKSTAAPFLLRDYLGLREFVNADTIASGLSAFDPESVAFGAGRIMLRRIQELANAGTTFAFETTLASRSFAPWIEELQTGGYRFHLSFLWLPSPEIALARVTTRVRSGGHSIPEETVRRRYGRGLRNLFSLYMPLADRWELIDNSQPGTKALIAEGERFLEPKVSDARLWKLLKGDLSMSRSQPDQNELIAARLADTDGILRALERAGQAVIEQARQTGEPVVIWRKGRVEHVSAEELLGEEQDTE